MLETYYKVRSDWSDASTQIGAFTDLANAKRLADQNAGYFVFDGDGIAIYPLPYRVQAAVSLAIFAASTGGTLAEGKTTGQAGTYTITEVADRRGRLLSGAGWVALQNLPVMPAKGVKTVTLAEKIKSVAENEVGRKGGRTYRRWYNATAAGKSDPKPAGENYCTVGALWALAQAGVDVSDVTARTAERTRKKAAKRNLWHGKGGNYRPKTGDLVLYHRNGKGDATHTELLLAQSGDKLTTVNFNSAGKVRKKARKISDSYTYGYVEIKR